MDRSTETLKGLLEVVRLTFFIFKLDEFDNSVQSLLHEKKERRATIWALWRILFFVGKFHLISIDLECFGLIHFSGPRRELPQKCQSCKLHCHYVTRLFEADHEVLSFFQADADFNSLIFLIMLWLLGGYISYNDEL